MIIKLVFVSIFAIQGISSELSLLESIMDSVGTQIVNIGYPEKPIDIEVDKIKNYCDKMNPKLFKAQKDRIGQRFGNGLVSEISNMIYNDLIANEHFGLTCKLIAKGEADKAVKMIQETNKHAKEAEKLRFQVLTAIHHATLKESKITIPELICYLNKYNEKMIALYPKKDGSKEYVQSVMDMSTGDIVKVYEKLKGKVPNNCRLPESTSNPSEYNFVEMALFTAIQNIDK